MAIGMSPKEYWEGDPYLVVDYKRAHNLKVEQRNQELWLQGLYIYNAFGTVLANAFAKKGSKKERYLEKPIRITPLTEQEKRVQAEEERKKVIAHFTRMEKQWRKKFGKKENKNGGND